MHRKPLISILTPVYNQAQFIGQTIRSVLNQTYQDWEWIVLDDGSTDATGDIIRQVKDSRIQYTYQEHVGISGLVKTYNKALSLCGGDYIAMLDHDDYWPAYKLDEQRKGFDIPDVVLSYGECTVVDHRNRKIASMGIPENTAIAENNPIGSALNKFIPERYCFIHNSTVMLKKQTLLDIGGFVESEGLFHDFPTWVRLSIEGQFSVLRKCLGYWRRHPSSAVLRTDQQQIFDAGITFLRAFLQQHEMRLQTLGIFFDTGALENIWTDNKNILLEFLPFNRTMLMLELGLFGDAAQEFDKFLREHSSLKHHLIALLIRLSGLLKIDMVNPLMSLKNTVLQAKFPQTS